jgi:molybdenum cofactor cytidylyltransferase
MILAAGASRRFGRGNKLLAPFRGKALVLHAADALHRASVNKLLAVTSDPEVTALMPEFYHIPGEKLLSQNIARGAAWAKSHGADRLLVVLGDMPFVTPAHCDLLIERCSDSSASASSSGGVRSPPACFPSAMFDDLIALTGDRGAKALIDAIPSQNIFEALGGELLDIDTQAEFEALKEQLH